MGKIKHNFKEGDKIGNSTFVRRTESKNGCPMAIVICECGKEFETRVQALVSGKTKSCGCLRPKIISQPKNIYIIGEQLGNCIYLGDAPYKPHNPRKANFLCQCGNEFITTIQNIENGTTKSCGCLTKQLLSEKGSLPEKKMPTLSVSDINRFWGKVEITSDTTQCWNWQANGERYGNFKINRSTYKSNRLSYFITYNIDPLELSVIHSCDNPKCCNPNHLSLATHWENMQDMAEKGRAFNGKIKK